MTLELPPLSSPVLLLAGFFGVCALLVMFRGLVRMAAWVLTFCLSAWAGFQVWQRSAGLAIEWTGAPHPWVVNGLPLAAFVLAWVLLRKIGRAMLARREDDDGPNPMLWIKGMALCALFSGLLFVTAIAILHHAGSVEEIRAVAENKPAGEPQRMAEWKQSIERLMPAWALRWIDPLSEPNRLELAKHIAGGRQWEPVIDPATGQPYPRAEIVEDPELRKLAGEGRYSTLLRHPLLDQALSHPELRRMLDALREPAEKAGKAP
jgi:hypothetical protein